MAKRITRAPIHQFLNSLPHGERYDILKARVKSVLEKEMNDATAYYFVYVLVHNFNDQEFQMYQLRKGLIEQPEKEEMKYYQRNWAVLQQTPEFYLAGQELENLNLQAYPEFAKKSEDQIEEIKCNAIRMQITHLAECEVAKREREKEKKKHNAFGKSPLEQKLFFDFDGYSEEEENEKDEFSDIKKFLDKWKPHKIVNFLNSEIIGQEDAKQACALFLYQHFQKLLLAKEEGGEASAIQKMATSIALVGPTGSGKTHIFRVLKKISPRPIYILDVSGLSPSGFAGDDLNEIIEISIGKDDDIEGCIIVFDEIDSVIRPEYDRHSSNINYDTQKTFLKLLEDGSLYKHGRDVSLKMSSFVLIGAYSELLDYRTQLAPQELREKITQYGMLAELSGRINQIIALKNLSEEDLYSILKLDHGYLADTKRLLSLDGMCLEINDSTLREIAHLAKKENIGARGLKTIIDEALSRKIFESYEKGKAKVEIVAKDLDVFASSETEKAKEFLEEYSTPQKVGLLFNDENIGAIVFDHVSNVFEAETNDTLRNNCHIVGGYDADYLLKIFQEKLPVSVLHINLAELGASDAYGLYEEIKREKREVKNSVILFTGLRKILYRRDYYIELGLNRVLETIRNQKVFGRNREEIDLQNTTFVFVEKEFARNKQLGFGASDSNEDLKESLRKSGVVPETLLKHVGVVAQMNSTSAREK